MSVLKIKDINGNWIDIPSIRGEDYVLTENDKEEIIQIISDGVTDKFYQDIDAIVPKNDASGVPIKLDDAIEYKALGFKASGNYHQETEPSPDNPSEVEVVEGDISVKNVGKNLNAGLRSGYYVIDTGVFANHDRYSCSVYPIYVKKGSTYIFSLNGVGIDSWTYGYDKEGNYLGRTTINASKDYKYKPNEDVYCFHYCFGNENLGVTPLESKVQIEDNDTITAYEPYKEQITYLDLKGEFIGKLPNGVQDYLTVDNQGDYGIQKNVGKVILNGSETWGINNTGDYASNPYFTARISDMPNGYYTNMLSNNFVSKNINATTKDAIQHATYYLLVQPSSLGLTTVEEFKTWLSENNVTAYYELAEPCFVNLGKATIKTLEGINNINLLANLEPSNMEITYALDIKKYTDKKIASLSSQLL